jgi:hypothetical protein
MDADPAIVCDTSVDPTYKWLRLWSTVSLVVYGMGTPLLFLLVLAYYRKEIKVDQVLRKTGLGYTRASNPHFAMRRRYVCLRAERGWVGVHGWGWGRKEGCRIVVGLCTAWRAYHVGVCRFQKLYSDFKSEKYAWRMMLLARKLLLVSTTVMFNQLPLFQVLPCLHASPFPFSPAHTFSPAMVCDPCMRTFRRSSKLCLVVVVAAAAVRMVVAGCRGGVRHVFRVHRALVGDAVPDPGERAADLLRHRQRRGL